MPARKPEAVEELLKSLLEEVKDLKRLIIANSPDHIIRKYEKIKSESK